LILTSAACLGAPLSGASALNRAIILWRWRALRSRRFHRALAVDRQSKLVSPVFLPGQIAPGALMRASPARPLEQTDRQLEHMAYAGSPHRSSASLLVR